MWGTGRTGVTVVAWLTVRIRGIWRIRYGTKLPSTSCSPTNYWRPLLLFGPQAFWPAFSQNDGDDDDGVGDGAINNALMAAKLSLWWNSLRSEVSANGAALPADNNATNCA